MKPYFIVYTLKHCNWCKKVIKLLDEREETYIVTDLTKNKQVLEEVKTMFDHATVPVVLYADIDNTALNLVGGYTELKEIFDELDSKEQEPSQEENVN